MGGLPGVIMNTQELYANAISSEQLPINRDNSFNIESAIFILGQQSLKPTTDYLSSTIDIAMNMCPLAKKHCKQYSLLQITIPQEAADILDEPEFEKYLPIHSIITDADKRKVCFVLNSYHPQEVQYIFSFFDKINSEVKAKALNEILARHKIDFSMQNFFEKKLKKAIVDQKEVNEFNGLPSQVIIDFNDKKTIFSTEKLIKILKKMEEKFKKERSIRHSI